jgi:hypothetical protein
LAFLFSNVCAYVKKCNKCQRFVGMQQLKYLPLKLVVVTSPFQQWGLDFIGEIHPPYSNQHKWILAATDYFTKWTKDIHVRNANHTMITIFLYHHIFSIFGFLKRLVTDNVVAFNDKALVKFCEHMGI